MPSLTEHNIQHNTQLLIQASKNGDLEEVKHLIPISDPEADHSEALWGAARNGHREILKLLIPVSDPKALNSAALRIAAANGHVECVKLLIPVSYPKANDSLSLQIAVEMGDFNIVKLLIPVSDYKIVLQEFEDCGDDVTILKQCIGEYEILQQRERLEQTLQDTSEIKNNKQISVKRKI